MIRRADVLVFLEDVQYTRRDWRNRNLIEVADKAKWLTIPVKSSGRYLESLDSMQISDPNWHQAHLSALKLAYSRCDPFDSVFPILTDAYQRVANQTYLSAINRALLHDIFELLGISIVTQTSHGLAPGLSGSDRILGICRELSASTYITGPAARSYMDIDSFAAAGINIEWVNYGHLPPGPPSESTEYSILHQMLKRGVAASRVASTLHHG
jgi:hypothetical protein